MTIDYIDRATCDVCGRKEEAQHIKDDTLPRGWSHVNVAISSDKRNWDCEPRLELCPQCTAEVTRYLKLK